MRFGGIVLCGGASKRMGQDKAEVVVAASLKEVFGWRDRVVAFLDRVIQPK